MRALDCLKYICDVKKLAHKIKVKYKRNRWKERAREIQ